MNKIRDILQITITSIYGIIMAVVFVLLIFFTNLPYGRKAFCADMKPALLLLSLGIASTALIYLASKVCASMSKKAWTITTTIIFVVLCILQMNAVKYYYFISDWDVGELNDISNRLVHGGELSNWNITYLSTYPNNRFILWIIIRLKTVFHAIGFHDNEYLMLIFVQCILNSLTGFLTVKIADKLVDNRRISFCCLIFFIALIGVSPWVVVPYTDSMGLVFPVAIFCAYFYRDFWKYSWVNWAVIGTLSAISAMIKPQLIIVTIAIVITQVIKYIRDKFTRESLISVGSFILCGIIFLGCVNFLVASLPIELDKEKSFSIYHYIMMGMNPDRMGVYSDEDVKYSRSFGTREERKEGNKLLISERMEKLGTGGLLDLYARKTLSNYNDGTFCWAGEGEFFGILSEDRGTSVSRFLRGLYYKKDLADIGIYNKAWTNFAQTTWLTTLLLSVFTIVVYKDSSKNVLAMSVIGLTIFQTIFECRARYLFVYAPVYILLAMYGLGIVVNVALPWVLKKIRSRKLPL